MGCDGIDDDFSLRRSESQMGLLDIWMTVHSGQLKYGPGMEE